MRVPAGRPLTVRAGIRLLDRHAHQHTRRLPNDRLAGVRDDTLRKVRVAGSQANGQPCEQDEEQAAPGGKFRSRHAGNFPARPGASTSEPPDKKLLESGFATGLYAKRLRSVARSRVHSLAGVLRRCRLVNTSKRCRRIFASSRQ